MDIFEKIAEMLDAHLIDYEMEIEWLVINFVIYTKYKEQWDDINLKERFSEIGLTLNSYSSIPETDFTPIGPNPTTHRIYLAFEYPVRLYGY